MAPEEPVQDRHLQPDEDQHDAEPVLQQVEGVHGARQQEVQVAQAEDREDVRGQHDERVFGDREDRRDRIDSKDQVGHGDQYDDHFFF